MSCKIEAPWQKKGFNSIDFMIYLGINWLGLYEDGDLTVGIDQADLQDVIDHSAKGHLRLKRNGKRGILWKR